MREQEHKREIERLWQEKLAVFQAQREIEFQEVIAKKNEEARMRMVIESEKARLLAEHQAIIM
jgi:hypothetical protein